MSFSSKHERRHITISWDRGIKRLKQQVRVFVNLFLIVVLGIGIMLTFLWLQNKKDVTLAALALVLGNAVIFGVVHESDEGTAARIWQILMAAQPPMVVYFLFKWLQKQPKDSLLVLTLLVVMWLANFAAIFWLT